MPSTKALITRESASSPLSLAREDSEARSEGGLDKLGGSSPSTDSLQPAKWHAAGIQIWRSCACQDGEQIAELSPWSAHADLAVRTSRSAKCIMMSTDLHLGMRLGFNLITSGDDSLLLLLTACGGSGS